MTTETADPLKSLEAERQRLDGLLQSDEAWRALRQLAQREAEGRPVVAIDPEGLKTRIESALSGNRVFLARTKIAEAITLLGGLPGQATASELPLTVSTVAEPPAMPRAVASPRSVAGPALGPLSAAETVPIVAAPSGIAASAEPATARDDLTRVRGIDRVLARKIEGLGVGRFADIARWTHADVTRISAALGLGRAISRQNWIEQAALLAAPMPGASTSHPIPAQAVAGAPLLPAAPGPPSPSDTKPLVRPISSVITDAARAILSRAIRHRPAPVTPTPESRPPVMQAPVTPAAGPAMVPLVEVIVASALPHAADQQPPDDLTLIRGIDRTWALALQRAGVSGFEAIARWSAGDVARICVLLGPDARVSKDQWIEQAAVLAVTGRTAFSIARDSALALHVVSAPDPNETAHDTAFAALLASPSSGESIPPPSPTLFKAPVEVAIRTPLAEAEPTSAESPLLAPMPPVRHGDPPNVATAFENSAAAAPAIVPSGFIALEDEHSLSDLHGMEQAASEAVSHAVPVAISSTPAFEPVSSAMPSASPAPTPVPAVVVHFEPSSAPRLPRTRFPELPLLVLAPVATGRAVDDGDLPNDGGPASDFELPDLSFAEADVEIVSRVHRFGPETNLDDVPPSSPVATAGDPASLKSRLRSARPSPDINASDYVAYRSQVEEASVEIVKRAPTGPKIENHRQSDIEGKTRPDGDLKTVRRFLKALTGQEK